MTITYISWWAVLGEGWLHYDHRASKKNISLCDDQPFLQLPLHTKYRTFNIFLHLWKCIWSYLWLQPGKFRLQCRYLLCCSFYKWREWERGRKGEREREGEGREGGERREGGKGEREMGKQKGKRHQQHILAANTGRLKLPGWAWAVTNYQHMSHWQLFDLNFSSVKEDFTVS